MIYSSKCYHVFDLDTKRLSVIKRTVPGCVILPWLWNPTVTQTESTHSPLVAKCMYGVKSMLPEKYAGSRKQNSELQKGAMQENCHAVLPEFSAPVAKNNGLVKRQFWLLCKRNFSYELRALSFRIFHMLGRRILAIRDYSSILQLQQYFKLLGKNPIPDTDTSLLLTIRQSSAPHSFACWFLWVLPHRISW